MNRRRAAGLVSSGLAAVAFIGTGAGFGTVLGSCGESGHTGPRAGSGLNVVVTIAPLAEIATRLAPAGSDVKILMPPGRSEHGYEFTPGDLATLSRADVVVYVGLGLEPQVEKFLMENPSKARQAVSFAAAVGLATLTDDGHGHDHSHDHAHDDPHGHSHQDHAHDHADAGSDAKSADPSTPDHLHDEGENHDGHDHGPIDPHLWLDPVMVRQLVPVVAGAMNAAMVVSGRESPDAARALVTAEEAMLVDVDAVDREYREGLKAFAGRAIVTHHSAWGRMAERYGLKVAAVLRPVESVEPTPGQVAEAVEAVKSSGARTVFVEPQFDAGIAGRVAEAAGVSTRTLDPLGNGKWCEMMRANLKELAAGL